MAEIVENSANKVKELTREEYFEKHKKVRTLENDPNFIELIENEEKRRKAIPLRVEKQFRRDGDKLYFKDADQKLAIHDKGDKLVAKQSHYRVAHAIVDIAEARGWSSMKVKGDKEFKREVWLEASRHGIKIEGYKPKEQDLQELVKRAGQKDQESEGAEPEKSKREGINSPTQTLKGELVKHGEAPLGFGKGAESSYFAQVKTPDGSIQTVWGKSIENGVRASGAKEGDQISLTYAAAKSQEKAVTGKLVEHGKAPFEHNPKNTASYYVDLDTKNGRKTVWGVDLERAMTESKAKPGEEITLTHKGQQPIKIITPQYGVDGEKTGEKEIEATRNTWEARKGDRLNVAAEAVINKHIQNPEARTAAVDSFRGKVADQLNTGKPLPEVRVYDKTAEPRQQQQHDIGTRPAQTQSKEQSEERGIER